MLDLLKQISEIPCVNGSEYLLSRFLKQYFEDKGFDVTCVGGHNLFVKRKNAKPKTAVFVPLDSPGYLCLYCEDGTAYVAPTSAALKKIEKIDQLCDYQGRSYIPETSQYDPKAFCIRDASLAVGTVFSFPCGLEISDEVVTGWHATHLVLLALLAKLVEQIQSHEVCFCFTIGFNTPSKAEGNILSRYSIKNAIFLGVSENQTDRPILAQKDGKVFSSPQLSERFLKLCEKNGIDVQQVISAEALTAAERSFSPSLEQALSLALPCSNRLSEQESVRLSSAEDLLSALNLFLNP